MPSTYYFPSPGSFASNEVDHWVEFVGYEPEVNLAHEGSEGSQPKGDEKVRIRILAPQNLSEANSQQYNTLPFSTIAAGAGGAKAFTEAIRNAGNVNSIGDIAGAAAEVAKSLLPTGAEAGAAIVGGLGELGQQARLMGFGTVRNPREQQHFKSPGFRTFSYRWELTPLTGPDQQGLTDLIHQFQTWTYPSVNNKENDYLISYKPPLQWRVRHITRNASGSFSTQKTTTTNEDGEETTTTSLVQNMNFGTFGTCIITNVDVNYSGAGIYSAAASEESGEAAPSFVGLTINFAAVKLLNKEYFDRIRGIERGDE